MAPTNYSLDPFGAFQVDYNAVSQELKVKVKLCWEFAEGFPDDEDTFKTAAIRNIMAVWDRARSFRCTAGTHNNKRAVPVFEIEDEDNETNAHFKFVVLSGHGTGALFPGEGKVRLYQYDAWTKDELKNSADLEKKKIGKSAKATLGGLTVRAVREMATALTDARKTITLNRTSQKNQTWVVSTQSKLDLQALVNHLNNRWPARLARPALIVKTASGVEAKATAMAQAVKTYIESRNPPADQVIQTEATTTKKKLKIPFTKHKKTGTALLGHENERTLYQSSRATNAYCTAAHEFGHCLGLPDEYCNSSPEADAGWRILIGRAHIGPAPARVGAATKYTGCIMHSGIVVERRHMVTIWEALTRNAGGTWTIS